jgi:hypothetical protein
MGQTTDQVETDIKHKREDLRSNLQELEHKVKSVTDWKQHFQNHPATMVAAAVGAGALIATLGRGRKAGSKRIESSSAARPDSTPSTPRAGTKHEVLETWDNVKSALVGVAATQVTGYLGRVVPGFQEQLKKTESSRTPSSLSASMPRDPAPPNH